MRIRKYYAILLNDCGFFFLIYNNIYVAITKYIVLGIITRGEYINNELALFGKVYNIILNHFDNFYFWNI